MNNMQSCIVRDNEGDGFWQPSIKGDCITIKVSPWNVPNTQHTVFLHELPKNGYVAEHSHEINEEIFICLDGEGIMTIDGRESAFKKHDVAYLAPLTNHSIRAISDIPLKMMVIISPAGLEERLKLMGVAKKHVNELPPEAFHSDIGKQDTHGVVKNK